MPIIPSRTIKPLDSIGQTIKVGNKVAYNRSGNVVPGIVLDIISHTQYGNPRLKYKIKNSIDDSISYVKDGLSILILEN